MEEKKKLSRLVCKLMPATQLRAQEKKNSAVGGVYLIVLSINDIASEPHIMVCLIPRQIPTTQSVHIPMVIMLIPQGTILCIANSEFDLPLKMERQNTLQELCRTMQHCWTNLHKTSLFIAC